MSMAVSGMGGGTPQVWSGASRRVPPAQKMANLFQQIDSSGSGTITKAQFDQAFQTLNPPAGVKAMGADAVFAKLDPSGSGSVSKQDFVAGMTSSMSQLRQQHQHRQTDASAAGSFAQTLAASVNALASLGSTTPPISAVSGSTIDTTA